MSIFAYMKNIVFDLGRVVFAQNPAKSDDSYKQFFSYVQQSPMPRFWVEYDLGISSFEKVVADLSEYRGVEQSYAREMLQLSIKRQETIEPTAELIRDLKAEGYQLYVLSNMSKEFIAYLRSQAVYSHFDGEVVSCEEQIVKPMPEIYELLLERYGLEPEHTIFIDDRVENVRAAERFGINTYHFDREDPASSCAELREMLL